MTAESQKTRSATLLLWLLFAAGAAAAASEAPKPRVLFTGKEYYETGGVQWTRYTLSVFNRSEFPQELFAASPDLPPCGTNTSSARAWVDIYDDGGKRLIGFCALPSTEKLGMLWFSARKDEAPPKAVRVIIDDRKLNRKYESDLTRIGEGRTAPKRTAPAK